jgi:DNA-binding CsgD family transcriptional regulator/tetratricopeptide (TPR) repeat protein
MPRSGSRLSPILIGRDDLLDLAERRIEEAGAGRRQFLLLAGEAGIGKSRLLSAIDTKARAAGFRTAGGFLAPQDRDVPVASLLDMARSMTRSEPWRELGQKLLELADTSIAAPRPQRRLLVLQAVDLIVGAIVEPTMLAFDDLQWADDLSLEILTELARATRDRPLLLVGVYRTDELAPDALLRAWRARLLTQRTAEEARLAPLTLEQTALMTTLILDTGLPAPRDVVAAVYERTDGVPLHIEELLGALGERERIDGRLIREAGVPDTLEDAILHRIRSLSPEAQVVARSGAVIGRCFVPEVLAGIMDVPADALHAPLRELLDEHVLDPPGVRGLYDFRHQVLRDVLYRSLPEDERRRLHARAGEFGGELEGASEIHASLHYERAGMNTQAFRSALQGARVAARLSSHRESFDLYRRAIDNLPSELPVAEQAEIFEAYAVEAAAVEETDLCEWAAGEARTRFQAAGDDVAAATQLVTLVGMARRRARSVADRLTAIGAAMEEIAALPPGSRTSSALAGMQIELGYVSLESLDLDAARAAMESGRQASRQAGDDEALLWVASLGGMLEVLDGRVEEGLDRIAAVAREARERGFEDGGVTAYRDGAVMAARVMDYPRAARFIDEGLRYADAIDQSHCAHVMAATGALVAWAEGRWDAAAAQGQHALADRGCERAAVMARWAIGYAALARGDDAAVVEHLGAAEVFAETLAAPDFVLAAWWGLAERDLLAGDHEQAIARTDKSLELATHTGERARFAPVVVTGVRARIAAGRPADAERWFADVAAFLGRRDRSAALDHAAGLLALAAGSLAAARASLERSVRGWDARGRVWEGMWARLDLAGCMLRLGRTVEGTKLIADVRASAEQLDSPPVLARVEELERLNRRHATEAAAWHPLTVREYEVARLIASGLTNGEIASELSISPRTVGAHVEHVLAKLGAARRTEIASWVATTVRPTPTRPLTAANSSPVPAGAMDSRSDR